MNAIVSLTFVVATTIKEEDMETNNAGAIAEVAVAFSEVEALAAVAMEELVATAVLTL